MDKIICVSCETEHYETQCPVCGFNDRKNQLDRIEKKLDKLNKKMDNHIREIWTVYEPIKKILEKLDKFRLW